MSSPANWYNDLPPVSKAFGAICFLTSLCCQVGVLNPLWLYLDSALVVRHFQIWRLVTNFFFLGSFSVRFGVRLLMIARYGVQLERGSFDKRTADFLWMMILSMITILVLSFTVPFLKSFFFGGTLVFVLLYVWSREFASARVSVMGLITVQGFWLPWALLAVNTMFGGPIMGDLLGILVGHAYYFLTVLHPRATGQYYLRTPVWLYSFTKHQVVADWSKAGSQAFSPVQPTTDTRASRSTFTGRSYRLDG